MEFLLLLVFIPSVCYFFCCHMKFSGLLVIRASIGKLRKWHRAEGKVLSVYRSGPAILRNPYIVTYEFETENGHKRNGKVVFPRSSPYREGDCVSLLYDPENPSLSRVEAELREAGILERSVFSVKSVKRIRIETIVYGLSCLAFAIAAFVADQYISVTSGALIMLYVFIAAIIMGLGVLKMHGFYSEKL